MTTRPASPFAVRGVIEGFYGNPWSHAQRLDLVAFISRHGMNTFVYGPKDDPLVRRDWRLPYDGPDLARMGELIDACRHHGIDFVYCLSPGLSIRYASDRGRRRAVGQVRLGRGHGRFELRSPAR